MRRIGGEEYWLHEDELPEDYPYDSEFCRSRLVNGVRIFPLFTKGVRVECPECGRVKKPIGRDTPAAAGSYCDGDCPGYRSDPQPDTLWPGEERR